MDLPFGVTSSRLCAAHDRRSSDPVNLLEQRDEGATSLNRL